MENQIRLKWTSHQGTILSIFDALLSTESLVDVTLACEGQYIRAHKMILSACSPYFQELINVDVNKHPIFFLKDVKYTELKALIHYMYRGEVNIAHEDLPSLLAVAQALKIRGLAEVETGNNSISSDTIILPDIGNKRVPKPPPPPPVAVPVPPPPPSPVAICTVTVSTNVPRTNSQAQEQPLVSEHVNSTVPGSIPAAVSGPPLAKKSRVETRFSQFPQVQIKLSRVVLVNPRCEVQPLPSLPIAPPHFSDPVQTTSLPSTSSSHYDSPGHSQDANYSHTGMVEDAEADGFAVKIEGTGPSDLEDKEDNSLSRSSTSRTVL